MIITCDQCDKRFEIESNLIPQKGRLLQCSSCSHKWFYKKDEQFILYTLGDKSDRSYQIWIHDMNKGMKDLNCKMCDEVTSCSEEAIDVTCSDCITGILCSNEELDNS